MTLVERLTKAAGEMRAVCNDIAESGYEEPKFTVHNLPRELFDEIPAISRVDDSDADDPTWEKRYRGVLYTCWQAPVVKL